MHTGPWWERELRRRVTRPRSGARCPEPRCPGFGLRAESWWQSETAPGAFFLLSVGFECDKLITARRPEKKVDCRMKAATHSSRTGYRKHVLWHRRRERVGENYRKHVLWHRRRERVGESGGSSSRDSLATKRELLIGVRLRHSRTSARKTHLDTSLSAPSPAK